MAKYIYMYQIFWMKMYKNQNVVFGLKSSISKFYPHICSGFLCFKIKFSPAWGHTSHTCNLSQIHVPLNKVLWQPPPLFFLLHILTSGVKFSSSSELDSMCSCPRTLTTMLVMSLHTVFRRCLVRIASVSSDRKNTHNVVINLTLKYMNDLQPTVRNFLPWHRY